MTGKDEKTGAWIIPASVTRAVAPPAARSAESPRLTLATSAPSVVASGR
jgi:hypothetical protein